MLERTLTGEPSCGATHWTGLAGAAACGLSLRTVPQIRDAHSLQPHGVPTFKCPSGPRFAVKLDDLVGLYIAPPRRAIVLSIHERSWIQA